MTSQDLPLAGPSGHSAHVPYNIPLPSKMELKGDQAANWNFFKEEWADYEIASGLDNEADRKRVATFKVALGRETRQILANLKLPGEKTKKVSDIISELDFWFTPKLNVIYERFLFGTAVQEENEPVDGYISRLRKLASTCEYKSLESEMIRDRLVIGIRSEDTKKKLLSDSKLSLETAIDTCRANEVADNQISSMKAKAEGAVNRIMAKQSKDVSRQKNQHSMAACRYCGTQHQYGRDNCPSYGKKCSRCLKYSRTLIYRTSRGLTKLRYIENFDIMRFDISRLFGADFDI